MDLSALLSDALHPALSAYYTDLFAAFPNSYPGAFRLRCTLNFGVQQLATRSRVAPHSQGYAQIGGFDAADLPAALIQAMPHTRVRWQPAGLDAAAVSARLGALRKALPADALPAEIDQSAPPPASCGLVAVFAEAGGLAPDAYRPWLGPDGRVLIIHRADPAAPPQMTLHA